MVIQNIVVNACTPQTIVIGRRTTYDTLQVVFDLSYLTETYGSGAAVLVVKRSQDETAYPATITQDGNTLTWTISETDTYYVGAGECELMWYVNNGLAKTTIYQVVVMRDILQTAEEPPDAYENWVEHLTELGAETQQNALDAAQSASDAESAKDDAVTAKEAAENAKEAAEAAQQAAETAVTHYPKIVNSYWYVWTNGEWVNTGVKAEGVDGRGIVSVTGQKTSTVGNVDTYTMTVAYTSGNPDTFTFTVTNGVDGYSPVVTITAITGGHRVTITDETHQTGQSFDVMNGEDSAVLSVAGKTGNVTLDANDVAFSESGTYDDGTVGKELSNQKNAIDHFESLEDNIVLVQDTQPTSPDNRIWVVPDDNEIEIPTMDELVMLQRVTKDADRIITEANDWEKGGINTSGVPGASNYTIRSKYKYPISPDTSVTFTGIKTKDGLNRLTYAYYYASDNTFIERNGTFVTPQNAAYVAYVYGWTSSSGQTVDAYGLANLVADWAITSKSKLDADIAALQAQIDESAEDISDLQTDTGNIQTQVTGISNDLNCGLFTFVDDDGYAESLEHWLDVSMASGIKITECVVTGWVGEAGKAPNYPYLDMLTWDDINTYNGVGFEFVSHSHNHLYFGGSNVGTAETLTADVEASQAALIAHKCNPDFLVYPGGHHQDTDGGIVDAVVRTHFKGAVAIANVANTTPLYTYSIFRYSLLDTANGKQSITDSDGNTRSVYPIHTLQWFKDLIDDAIANKKWVVFMSHLYNYGDYYYNSDIKTTLVEVAKYITTQGGKIMRLSDAFAIRKNRFESAPRQKTVSYIVDYRGQVYDKH